MGRDDLSFDEFFKEFYELIIGLRDSGRLIRKTTQVVAPPEPEPVDPATTLPHQNISMLRNIRTLLDVQNLTAEDARKFLQPGAPRKEFEERVAYIRKHEIMESTKPYSASKTQLESATTDGGYGGARALVAAITYKDVGSIGSAPGQSAWDKALKFKDRVGRIIDQQERKGTSERAVLTWVKNEIEALRSSSIH